MSDRTSAPPAELLAALQELVEALDRRVPRLERSGEIQIAKDAAMLRNEAVTRIAALEASLGLGTNPHGSPAGDQRSPEPALDDAVLGTTAPPTT